MAERCMWMRCATAATLVSEQTIAGHPVRLCDEHQQDSYWPKDLIPQPTPTDGEP